MEGHQQHVLFYERIIKKKKRKRGGISNINPRLRKLGVTNHLGLYRNAQKAGSANGSHHTLCVKAQSESASGPGASRLWLGRGEHRSACLAWDSAAALPRTALACGRAPLTQLHQQQREQGKKARLKAKEICPVAIRTGAYMTVRQLHGTPRKLEGSQNDLSAILPFLSFSFQRSLLLFLLSDSIASSR